MPKLKNPVIVVLVVLVMANLIALWIVNFVQNRKVLELEESKSSLTRQITELVQPVIPKPSPSPTSQPIPSPSPSPSVSSPPDMSDEVVSLESDIVELQSLQGEQSTLLAGLQTSIQNLWTKLTQVEEAATTTRTVTQVIEREVSVPIGGSSVKEQIFYMGSGSTNNRDWKTIDAATITIDSNNFIIHEVRFEAGLSIIGGEVHARLINKDSGGFISNSELQHNNQTATWKSNVINLIPGNNTYQVQLKSTSGETATLHGARIKIYTN